MPDDSASFDAVAKRLRAALGLTSDVALAERMGFKQSAWAARKGRNALPMTEVEALCGAHHLNKEWVLFGHGEPRPDMRAAVKTLQDAASAVAALSLPQEEARLLQELLQYTFAGDRDRLLPLVAKLGLVTVPRYDISASAGNGSTVTVHDESAVDAMAFRGDWLRSIGVSPKTAVVIAVRGDSMADTLQDGDLILVDTSLVERRVPGVYVIVKGDTLLVKRLHFKLNGTVEIRSDNKAYPTETMSGAEFEQLHLVGRMARRLVR